ncbi:MAG: helix-turn-helix transcriptional regulator [Treponema sp.]|nr:helix-turn-helix transcriptional regulator [Treponema sp.]
MSFGENLREMMKAMNFTAAELAQRTEISKDTINSYLKTDGPIPSADKAVKIAKALGTSVEFLVTGFEKTNGNQVVYDIHKMRRYAKTIDALDSLPEISRTPIEDMISDMSEKMVSTTNQKA